jgi:AAA+ superfamily predicted ATPase
MKYPWTDEVLERIEVRNDFAIIAAGNVYDMNSLDGKPLPALDLLAHELWEKGHAPILFNNVTGFRVSDAQKDVEQEELETRIAGGFGKKVVPYGGEELDAYNEMRQQEQHPHCPPIPPRDDEREFRSFLNMWSQAMEGLATMSPDTSQAQIDTWRLYECHDLLLPIEGYLKEMSDVFMTDSCDGAHSSMQGMFEECEKEPQKLVIIIEDAHNLMGKGTGGDNSKTNAHAAFIVINWAGRFYARNSHVVLASDSIQILKEDLRQNGGVGLVDVPMPMQPDLKDFASEVAGIDHLDCSDVARALSGVSYAVTLRVNKDDDIETLKKMKEQEITQRHAGLLKVVRPVHGLETLVLHPEIVATARVIVGAMRSGNYLLIPQGLLTMGPPGTAKSSLALAVAKEAGFSFVQLDRIKDMWVGESERRMELALRAIVSIAPVVVLEDEAEGNWGARTGHRGDSGVTEALQAQRFSFTADPENLKKGILWWRCTNRPDLMDVADLRSGRSSYRLPMLMPEKSDASDILLVIAKKHGIELASDVDVDEIADQYYKADSGIPAVSGADLEEIVLRSYRKAHRERGDDLGQVNMTDMTWAAKDFIPSASLEEIEAQEILAVLTCSSRSMLPTRYLKQVDNRPSMRAKLDRLVKACRAGG